MVPPVLNKMWYYAPRSLHLKYPRLVFYVPKNTLKIRPKEIGHERSIQKKKKLCSFFVNWVKRFRFGSSSVLVVKSNGPSVHLRYGTRHIELKTFCHYFQRVLYEHLYYFCTPDPWLWVLTDLSVCGFANCSYSSLKRIIPPSRDLIPG